jgi:hypothetical protein
MNIRDEFNYVDSYFENITKEELVKGLIDCGLNKNMKFSIEKHCCDEYYVLYYGRDLHHHGYNLCTISDFDNNGESIRALIVNALNNYIKGKHNDKETV